MAWTLNQMTFSNFSISVQLSYTSFTRFKKNIGLSKSSAIFKLTLLNKDDLLGAWHQDQKYRNVVCFLMLWTIWFNLHSWCLSFAGEDDHSVISVSVRCECADGWWATSHPTSQQPASFLNNTAPRLWPTLTKGGQNRWEVGRSLDN